MVTVKTLGIRSFTLRGGPLLSRCTREHEVLSSISVNEQGWAVILNIPPFPIQHNDSLSESEVIPTIKKMLADCQKENVYIDEIEIRDHIAHVKDFTFKELDHGSQV